VVVSTCEHTHAFADAAGAQAGQHVYCEKPPPVHSRPRELVPIWVARLVLAAASRIVRASQML